MAYLDAGKFYKCSECEGIYPAEEWFEGDVGCDDCGSHPGAHCPNDECVNVYDFVYALPEEFTSGPHPG